MIQLINNNNLHLSSSVGSRNKSSDNGGKNENSRRTDTQFDKEEDRD